MARYELLNNITHKDLRVSTRFGTEFGDNLGMVQAFPTEFAELQREYPIFFRKDSSGEFQAAALLGFDHHENLFLQGGGWNAAYLPGAVARGPFLIGFQEQQVDGQVRNEPVIHVDLDHPRVRAGTGEALFQGPGIASEFLERARTTLLMLHDGLLATPAFVDALQRHQLLESFVLDIRLDDGSDNRLAGFHTIDERRLQALDGSALEQLSRDGHLLPAYMVLASLSRFRDLIERMNRRRAAGR